MVHRHWRQDSGRRPDGLTPETIKLIYPADIDWKLDWQVANTGVMILDISQLRSREADKDLLDIATRHRLPFLEQDCWNLYCQGDWLELDGRWNLTMMTVMDYIGMGGDPGKIPQSPFIVHFCGKPKPWDCKLSAHLPWIDQYYKRLATTQWGGLFPKNESAERIEAAKCILGLKMLSRQVESGQGPEENERRFLPSLRRTLARSISTIRTDSPLPWSASTSPSSRVPSISFRCEPR